MRLLVITQAVDRSDPILGFFHGWLRAMGEAFDGVIAIGQRTGQHSLPPTVKVRSLGKERGRTRIGQIMQFYADAWSLRRDYDAVLVHMTPIWVVLGGPLWLMLGKPVYLWYEARGARWPLRLALLFVTKVFSASSSGMPWKSVKTVVVGHGIDTDLFAHGSESRDASLVVTVGRITRSKHLERIVDCFVSLPGEKKLRIAGAPITAADHELVFSLQSDVVGKGVGAKVKIEPVLQSDLPVLLRAASLFLHASDTSLDKALLEAMACGCPVVSCAEAARGVLPEQCIATPEAFSSKAQAMDLLSSAEKELLGERLRQIVVKDHSLQRLVNRLQLEMTQK